MSSAGQAAQPDRPVVSPYSGRLIAVGTKHGKQAQLEPAFRRVLGASLHTPANLDTDQFGTFTGEKPRTGAAIDAARAKANLAIRVSGLAYGLASEASYGPLPGSGLPGHEEILLFCDDRLGIEILEGYRTASVPGTCHLVADAGQVPDSLLAGLPAQALVVRPHEPRSGVGSAIKGITDRAALRLAVESAADRSPDGLAAVEPDLRAQHNPSRREVLERLGFTLAHRLATPCPACGTPGFGRIATEPGLPCRSCAAPTTRVRGEIHGCASCAHQLTRYAAEQTADPADCPDCNP